jgi:DNA-binding beta-propeller fold protein YncE
MRHTSATRTALTGLTASALMLVGATVMAGSAGAAADTGVPWKVYFGRSAVPEGFTGGLRVMSNASRSTVASVPITIGFPADILFTPNSTFGFLIGADGDAGVGLVTPIAVGNNHLGTPIKAGVTLTTGAITPDGKTLYVSGPDVWDPFGGEGEVQAIDVATRTVLKNIDLDREHIETPPASTIAITPDGAHAWSFGYGQIVVIDTATNTVVHRASADSVFVDSGVTPDGSGVYAAAARPVPSSTTVPTGFLVRYDPQTRQETDAIPLPGIPAAMAVSANGRVAYIATQEGQFFSVNLATRAIGAPSSVGGYPRDIALTPDGAIAYVVNAPTNRAVPVTLATGAVGASIPLGTSAESAAVAPDQAPVAKLTMTRLTSRKIGFDASSSTVKYGDIARLTWNFGDGTTRTTVGAKVTHTYARAGSYRVTLTAVSEGGTSTTRVFTGQGVLRNGGPQARVTTRIVLS